MECLCTFLNENGFRIGTGTITTVKTLYGEDGLDDGLANYINTFRDKVSPARVSYTIALAEDYVVVAIDCDVSAMLESIDKYAEARFRNDVPSRIKNSNVVPRSLEVISVSGELRYRYDTRSYEPMGIHESTVEVSAKEVGDAILEYARKAFPKEFLPPEGTNAV